MAEENPCGSTEAPKHACPCRLEGAERRLDFVLTAGQGAAFGACLGPWSFRALSVPLARPGRPGMGVGPEACGAGLRCRRFRPVRPGLTPGVMPGRFRQESPRVKGSLKNSARLPPQRRMAVRKGWPRHALLGRVCGLPCGVPVRNGRRRVPVPRPFQLRQALPRPEIFRGGWRAAEDPGGCRAAPSTPPAPVAPVAQVAQVAQAALVAPVAPVACGKGSWSRADLRVP
jgi:hypothetical protein